MADPPGNQRWVLWNMILMGFNGDLMGFNGF